MNTKEFIIRCTSESAQGEINIKADSYSMSDSGMMDFYRGNRGNKVLSIPMHSIEFIKQVTEDEEGNVAVAETKTGTSNYDAESVQDGHFRYEGKAPSSEFSQEEEIPEGSAPQKDPGTGWEYVDNSGSKEGFEPKDA